MRRAAVGLAALALACAPALRQQVPEGSAARDPELLYRAIQSRIHRIDHEPGVDRAALASAAVEDGQECLARAPQSAPCHYGLALALGVQARERPVTARDGLRRMVEQLGEAARLDPALDQAGPDRVLALVLARAPAWPAGPGDPEEAVQAARRAIRLAPDHPPNLLALAEALLAAGDAVDTAEARDAARRGIELARASSDPDAAGWIKDGEKLLARAGK